MAFIFETDLLLAIINSNDPLHIDARRIITNHHSNMLLSPYSVLEINLLIRAGKIETSDMHRFMKSLQELLSAFGIKIILDNANYHSKAAAIESKYRLSFFDSLHAAVAIEEGHSVISSDHSYDRIPGLNKIHPRSDKLPAP